MWEPSDLPQRSVSIISGLLTEVKIILGKIRKPDEEPSTANGASGRRIKRSRGTTDSREKETTEYEVERFCQKNYCSFHGQLHRKFEIRLILEVLCQNI